jgi:hypothetical protein
VDVITVHHVRRPEQHPEGDPDGGLEEHPPQRDVDVGVGDREHRPAAQVEADQVAAEQRRPTGRGDAGEAGGADRATSQGRSRGWARSSAAVAMATGSAGRQASPSRV